MPTASERRLADWFWFVLLAAAFALLRLETVASTYSAGTLRLIDPDSYYHLRRTLQTLATYPRLPVFDSFLSYPYGDNVPWPPLFDLLSATLLLPFAAPERIAPALNMVYFFCAFALLFCSLRRREGLTAAVVAGAFIAYAGILRVYTSFGRFDHHAFELFMVTGLYLSFQRYYNDVKIRWLLVFMLFTLAAFFTWPGAVVYFVPIVLFVFYRLLRGGIDARVFKGLFVAFHATAIIIAVYLRLTALPDFPPYSYKFLSGFQRDFCFLISVIFITVYFTLLKKFNRTALWTVNTVVLIVLFHKFLGEIVSGVGYVVKSEELVVLAEETAPLFFSPFYRLKDEFERALFFFTPLFFLFPAVLYVHIRRRGVSLIALFTSFFLLFTLAQLRFGYFFMLGYAVMLGETVSAWAIRPRTLAAFVALFCVLSVVTYIRESKTAGTRFPSDGMTGTMRFLRERTPDKDAFLRGETPYGVLSGWHLGHYIITDGSRPAVAHNFIGVSKKNGEKIFIRALFAASENEVAGIMDSSRARFVVVDDPASLMATDWRVLSREENPYVDKQFRMTDAGKKLFLYRLSRYDGVTPPFTHSPASLRLVFETSPGRNSVNDERIKVFERVAGAHIQTSHTDAVLKARIITPLREFTYVSAGTKTPVGRSFQMPYSVDGPYDATAREVVIEAGGRRIPITVTEADVLTGRTLTVR